MHSNDMPQYYFDFHERERDTVDDTGLELPTLARAESEALDALGDLLREHTLQCPEDRIEIEVRNGDRTVFRVSAVVRLHRA
jgi:hypothetical protein